ncbi:MAG: hypothetical protein EA382_16555, partial [Spirochaetaceae bacterium]
MHGLTTTSTENGTETDIDGPSRTVEPDPLRGDRVVPWVSNDVHRYAGDRRPYVRWWWFAEPIATVDVDRQLDWLAANAFGGVEIAFVYPRDPDVATPEFLGAELVAALVHCRRSCASRGLGMDVTFGTLWPFGGSMVGEADASRTFTGPS